MKNSVQNLFSGLANYDVGWIVFQIVIVFFIVFTFFYVKYIWEKMKKINRKVKHRTRFNHI